MNRTGDGPVVQLENPIDVREIIDGKCPTFSIVDDPDLFENNNAEENTNMVAAFPYEFLEKYEMEGLEEPGYFTNLKQSMTKLLRNGKIHKKIEREGYGEIPKYDDQNKKYVLEFYYAAYHEETVDPLPFDVHAPPYKRPKSVVIGENSIIQGLEIAIKSMRKGERSIFLVHPYLAYRNGILDRIPKDATILFNVELVNIREWNENDERVDEELPSSFEKTLKKAAKLHEDGNELKKKNKLLPAVQKYNQANKLIINMRFKNEEEEKQAYEKLLTVYSNLAICHWELENYRQVCNMFNSAKYVCPSRTYKHIKLLYFSSKALRMLGNYKEAEKRIGLALQVNPDLQDLIKEKQTLRDTIESAKKNERDFFKRMLNVENQPEEEAERKVDEHMREEMEALVINLHRLLDVFVQEDEREVVHDLSFTDEEMQLCSRECSKRKIKIREEGSKIRFMKTGF